MKPDLILKCDGIAWCSFNVEGSVLTVDISEAKDSSKDKDIIPSNIIATTDGVIISAEVAKGTRIIENGQAVRKGDLLVSGAINYGEKTDFIQSEGTIIAETDRTFKKTVPFKFTEKVLTGKKRTLCVLDFFNLKIPLFLPFSMAFMKYCMVLRSITEPSSSFKYFPLLRFSHIRIFTKVALFCKKSK